MRHSQRSAGGFVKHTSQLLTGVVVGRVPNGARFERVSTGSLVERESSPAVHTPNIILGDVAITALFAPL